MTLPASSSCRSFASARLALALGAALLLAATGVQAQFKVIGADGKVTYTDREPSQPEGKVTALGAKAPVAGRRARPALRAAPGHLEVPGDALHHDRRVRAVRAGAPVPEAARRSLQRAPGGEQRRHRCAREDLGRPRGADAHRRHRRSCAASPRDSWGQYLDAAGYPRESRLPSTYQYRAATPIVERRDAAVARTRRRRAAGAGSAAARDRADSAGPVRRHPLLARRPRRPRRSGKRRLRRVDVARRQAAARDRRSHQPEQRRRAERRAGEAERERHHRARQVDRHRAQAIASPWRAAGVIWCSVVMTIGWTAPSARPRTTAQQPITHDVCASG